MLKMLPETLLQWKNIKLSSPLTSENITYKVRYQYYYSQQNIKWFFNDTKTIFKYCSYINWS